MLRKTALFAALPVCLVVSACGDSTTAPSATNPIAAPTRGASFSIYDGAHGGSDRFYFLPPLVSNPKIGPANDEAIFPALTVTVCALSGTSCVAGDPIVRYLPSNDASGKGDCTCGGSREHHGSDDPDYRRNNDWHGDNGGWSRHDDKSVSGKKLTADRDEDGKAGDEHFDGDHSDGDNHDDDGSHCTGTPGIALTGNHYQVTWNSGAFTTSTSTDYRVTVFASGVELGHVDVDILGKHDSAKPDFIGLAQGAQLLIPFRVTAGVIKSLTVSPADTSVTAGATFQYKFTAVDYSNAPVTGRTATWTSSNPAVGTVDQYGAFKAVGAGTTTVTLTVDGHVVTATVTVASAATSFTLSPTTASLTLGGTTTAALTVTASGPNGPITSGLNPTWVSDNPAVTVTPNSSGFGATVTAVSIGVAHVTVSLAGLPPQSATIVVNPAANTAPPISIGQNGNFVQVPLNPATILGAPVPPGATYSFTSSDPTTVQVDPTTGVVTPRGDGSATITLTVFDGNGNIIGTQVISVQPPAGDPCIISAASASNTLKPLGDHVMHIFAPGEQITADVAGLPASWQSISWTLGSNPAPVTVAPNGASATITAGQSSGNVTLNVRAIVNATSQPTGVACLYVTGASAGSGGGVVQPVPTTVRVTSGALGSSVAMDITDNGGQSLPVHADVYDQNGNLMSAAGLSFTWASGSGAVSVTGNGSADAVIQAQSPTTSASNITASISGTAATGTLVVTSVADARTPAPVATTITIDPSVVNLSILADGTRQTQQLVATVRDQNGNVIDPSTVSFQWSSGGNGVSLSSVGNVATLTALQASDPLTPFTVGVTVGNARANVTVLVVDLRPVTPPPGAPVVTPAAATCTIGSGQNTVLSATPPAGGSLTWTLATTGILSFTTTTSNAVIGSTVSLSCHVPQRGTIPATGVTQQLNVVATAADGTQSPSTVVNITVFPQAVP